MHNDPYRQMFFEAHALSRKQISNPLGPDWRINCLLEDMNLETGSRVLLAGCGVGKLIPHLKVRLGLSGQLIAVDNSAETLSRVRPQDAKWATLILSGLDKIPVIDDSMDAVIYPFSAGHITGLSNMAAEFYRTLKTGGQAFVINPPPSSGLDFNRPCPFGLNDVFLKAGFNRIDFDDDLNLYFFAAQKLAPYLFIESGSA